MRIRFSEIPQKLNLRIKLGNLSINLTGLAARSIVVKCETNRMRSFEIHFWFICDSFVIHLWFILAIPFSGPFEILVIHLQPFVNIIIRLVGIAKRSFSKSILTTLTSLSSLHAANNEVSTSKSNASILISSVYFHHAFDTSPRTHSSLEVNNN